MVKNVPPSALADTLPEHKFRPRESSLDRSPPAAVLIAPDDSLVMADKRALELLRAWLGEPVWGSALEVRSHRLRSHIRLLRHALSIQAPAAVDLSGELCIRGSLLRGAIGEYLLMVIEPVNRRDAVQEQLSLFGFTPREYEVAELVVAGMSNRQIVIRLNIAENTVESHIKRILTKASVPSRAALVSKILWGTRKTRPNR